MKTLLTVLCLAGALCFAQQNSPQDMKGMNMPGHDMSQMSAQDSKEDADASMHAMHSMEGHHMDMGPHMNMTALRTPQPGDAEKAQKVVEAARGVMEKYKDYHVALNEQFQDLPSGSAAEACITSPTTATRCEAAFKFNPEHPTSLLYEKDGDGYRLVGLMYTAPKRFTEDDLNQRIPLSIAQWHEHVNFCRAPAGRRREALGPNPKFGLRGSITTQEECDATAENFFPSSSTGWCISIRLRKTQRKSGRSIASTPTERRSSKDDQAKFLREILARPAARSRACRADHRCISCDDHENGKAVSPFIVSWFRLCADRNDFQRSGRRLSRGPRSLH